MKWEYICIGGVRIMVDNVISWSQYPNDRCSTRVKLIGGDVIILPIFVSDFDVEMNNIKRKSKLKEEN